MTDASKQTGRRLSAGKAIVVIVGRHRPEQMSSMNSTWRSNAGLERGFDLVLQLQSLNCLTPAIRKASIVPALRKPWTWHLAA